MRCAYQDLVGTEHLRMNCWSLVREIHRRCGVDLPADPDAASWREVREPLEWGDVARLSSKGFGVCDSLAVRLDGDQLLTSFEHDRVRIVRLQALEARCTLLGWSRHAPAD